MKHDAAADTNINLILRSALLSLSKDARVSKDGRVRGRAPWPSFETRREAAALLRMRSTKLDTFTPSGVR